MNIRYPEVKMSSLSITCSKYSETRERLVACSYQVSGVSNIGERQGSDRLHKIVAQLSLKK